MTWYVAFMSEVIGHDGRINWWPNARIVREHPLLWQARKYRETRAVIVIMWFTEIDIAVARMGDVIIEPVP